MGQLIILGSVILVCILMFKGLFKFALKIAVIVILIAFIVKNYGAILDFLP